MNTAEIVAELLELLAIPSPTGRAEPAADHCAGVLQGLGLEVRRTPRGAVVAVVPGVSGAAPRALTAHVDTLGAQVAELLPDGRLRLSPIGGLPAASCDGAAADVLTAEGPVSGTILPEYASAHVFGPKYESQERTWEKMRLRLDLPPGGDKAAAPVRVGDFVALDPLRRLTPGGFVRSRFLDDKAGVAALLAAAREIAAGPRPPCTAYLHFSVSEEVGQGAPAGIPGDVAEIVAVDMAAVGQGQASREDLVSICAKDSGGPYDFALRERLQRLAEAAGIPHCVDVYPFYASDATAAARAGHSARIGLFGPGVDASHTHERTHERALRATAELALAYLRAP